MAEVQVCPTIECLISSTDILKVPKQTRLINILGWPRGPPPATIRHAELSRVKKKYISITHPHHKQLSARAQHGWARFESAPSHSMGWAGAPGAFAQSADRIGQPGAVSDWLTMSLDNLVLGS